MASAPFRRWKITCYSSIGTYKGSFTLLSESRPSPMSRYVTDNIAFHRIRDYDPCKTTVEETSLY